MHCVEAQIHAWLVMSTYPGYFRVMWFNIGLFNMLHRIIMCRFWIIKDNVIVCYVTEGVWVR